MRKPTPVLVTLYELLSSYIMTGKLDPSIGETLYSLGQVVSWVRRIINKNTFEFIFEQDGVIVSKTAPRLLCSIRSTLLNESLCNTRYSQEVLSVNALTLTH